MKLSARTEYACIALLHLADAWTDGAPVQVRRIAEEQGIPARFLVQILLQLKGYGLVASIRGAGGGYRLSRPPQEVSLLEILEVMEGDDWPTSACAKSSPLGDVLLDLRQDLCRAQRERLSAISLVDLAERASVSAEPMWYI